MRFGRQKVTDEQSPPAPVPPLADQKAGALTKYISKGAGRVAPSWQPLPTSAGPQIRTLRPNQKASFPDLFIGSGCQGAALSLLHIKVNGYRSRCAV
jgi:hypothetical protein